MEDEVRIQFQGNAPEIFKKVLFYRIKSLMSDIKSEILKNKGFVYLNYINDSDIELRAVCENKETLLSMTVRLHNILPLKSALN